MRRSSGSSSYAVLGREERICPTTASQPHIRSMAIPAKPLLFSHLPKLPRDSILFFPHPQPKLAGKQTSGLRISQRFIADRKHKVTKVSQTSGEEKTRMNSRFGRKGWNVPNAWNESNNLAIGRQVDEASTCACQMMLLFSFFLRYITANAFSFLWLCSQRMRCSRRSSAIC